MARDSGHGHARRTPRQSDLRSPHPPKFDSVSSPQGSYRPHRVHRRGTHPAHRVGFRSTRDDHPHRHADTTTWKGELPGFAESLDHFTYCQCRPRCAAWVIFMRDRPTQARHESSTHLVYDCPFDNSNLGAGTTRKRGKSVLDEFDIVRASVEAGDIQIDDE